MNIHDDWIVYKKLLVAISGQVLFLSEIWCQALKFWVPELFGTESYRY